MSSAVLAIAAALAVHACGRSGDTVGLDPAGGADGAALEDGALPSGQDGSQPGPGEDAAEPADGGTLEPGADALPGGHDAAQQLADGDVQPALDGAIGIDRAGPMPRPDAGPMPRPDGGPLPAPDAGAQRCAGDADCGRGQHCDTMTGRCVQCVEDSQCIGPGRICDEAGGNVCRFQCLNGACGPRMVCDPATDACVECLADMDCGNGEVCDTARKSCVACLRDEHCIGQVGSPRCDTSRFECVGCLGDAHCTAPEICEPRSSTCVVPANRPLCSPCTDDAQCGGPNDLCIGLSFGGGGGNLVDRACAIDCSNSPCPRGFECLSVRQGTARQCRPSYPMQTPTCTAVSHLGLTCPFSANDPDPGCGLSGLQDARCIADTSGMRPGICTIWCENDTHCPTGFTCRGQSGMQTLGVCLP